MSEKSERKRRKFSAEFKQDAVDLVVKQGYSISAAAQAVGVEYRSLKEWHARLAPQPEPCGDDASVEELRKRTSGCESNFALQATPIEKHIEIP